MLALPTVQRVNDIKPTALHNSSAMSKLLIRQSAVNRYQKKCEFNGAVRQLFMGFEKAYDLRRKEVLYSILIESGL